jgi:hypothetical protein
MMKQTIVCIVAIGLTLASGDLLGQAQTPTATTQAQAPSDKTATKSHIPLRVQVVISSYKGEKKLSSVPYLLSVNAAPPPFPGKASQLRMGSRIPVPVTRQPKVDGKPISELPGVMTTPVAIDYQDIGTSIDCSANFMDDGRFELNISVEDTSVVSDQTLQGSSKADEAPIFRSFRLSNQIILRDGQATQFTAATDRITGETIRVDVTLNVTK